MIIVGEHTGCNGVRECLDVSSVSEGVGERFLFKNLFKIVYLLSRRFPNKEKKHFLESIGLHTLRCVARKFLDSATRQSNTEQPLPPIPLHSSSLLSPGKSKSVEQFLSDKNTITISQTARNALV